MNKEYFILVLKRILSRLRKYTNRNSRKARMDVLLKVKNRKHNEIIKTTFCFLTSATRLVTTATWLKLH